MKKILLSLHRMARLALVSIFAILTTSCSLHHLSLKLESCNLSEEGCVLVRLKQELPCLTCLMILHTEEKEIIP